MVSTRRQKLKSDPEIAVDGDIVRSDGGEDHLKGVEPASPKTSANDESDDSPTKPSTQHERIENQDHSDHVSDLFVLDRTGADEDLQEPIESEKNLSSKKPKRKSGTAADARNTQTKSSNSSGRKKMEKNELTKLIKGYTAPMRLNASSLDKFRATGGIKALQKRAERTDASTRDFVMEATGKHTNAMQTKSTGILASSYTEAYSSFKKGVKRAPDSTAGKGWFGMVPTPMTEELKMDLAVIRNRNYLDPKRFYKSADRPNSVIQVGTVIEGAAEFYSSRLTKKQRRNNFTEEIMADPASADYARNKFREMSREKTRKAQKRGRVHKPKRGKRFF